MGGELSQVQLTKIKKHGDVDSKNTELEDGVLHLEGEDWGKPHEPVPQSILEILKRNGIRQLNLDYWCCPEEDVLKELLDKFHCIRWRNHSHCDWIEIRHQPLRHLHDDCDVNLLSERFDGFGDQCSQRCTDVPVCVE